MDVWYRGQPQADVSSIIDNRNMNYFFHGQPAFAQPLVNTNTYTTPAGGSVKGFIRGLSTWLAQETDNRGLDYFTRGISNFQIKKPMAYIYGTVMRGNFTIANAKVVCLPDDLKGILGITYTDSNGYYRFNLPPNKKYSLYCEYEINGQKYSSTNYWDITPKED